MASGQDIPESQVPTAAVQSFKSNFTKARDVEWERAGDLFKVEFEIRPGRDHEVWYDGTGKVIKHQEEIPRRELPQAVTKSVSTGFSGYRIDDVKKITTDSTTTYVMELDSNAQDWKITVDAGGKLINKRAD